MPQNPGLSFILHFKSENIVAMIFINLTGKSG